MSISKPEFLSLVLIQLFFYSVGICRSTAGILTQPLLLTGLVQAQPADSKKPVKIIYDTDIDLDVDDASALALLHALSDNGEAEILGVICNVPTPCGATP